MSIVKYTIYTQSEFNKRVKEGRMERRKDRTRDFSCLQQCGRGLSLTFYMVVSLKAHLQKTKGQQALFGQPN